MSTHSARVLVVLVVAAHLALLLAYTLPRSFVPDRARMWSMHHVRPLFHQQWNLFAPDPSICACRVEVDLPDGSWRPVIPDDRHYLLRRMARPLAELIRSGMQHGDAVLRPELASALRGLTRDIGREAPGLRFRLVQRCIIDPAVPVERAEIITPLRLPEP